MIKVGDRVRTLPPYEVNGYTVKNAFTGIVTDFLPNDFLTVQERPDRNHRPVPITAVEKVEEVN